VYYLDIKRYDGMAIQYNVEKAAIQTVRLIFIKINYN